MRVPIISNDRAILTARAGILRAGTGRANAAFAADQMSGTRSGGPVIQGKYVWEDVDSDISTAAWVTIPSPT